MGPNDALKIHRFTHILWYYGVPVITMGVPIPLPIWVRCSQVWVQVWEKKPEGHPCHALVIMGVSHCGWGQKEEVVVLTVACRSDHQWRSNGPHMNFEGSW